jgi:hypothetical protein
MPKSEETKVSVEATEIEAALGDAASGLHEMAHQISGLHTGTPCDNTFLRMLYLNAVAQQNIARAVFQLALTGCTTATAREEVCKSDEYAEASFSRAHFLE